MTDHHPSAMPADPAMAANDPGMFARMTSQDIEIARQHLLSGWYKQAVVYPVLSEPWKETSIVLDDMGLAWDTAYFGEAGRRHQPPAREAQPGAGPEAGL